MDKARPRHPRIAATTGGREREMAALRDLLQRAQVEAYYLGLHFTAQLIAIPLSSLEKAEEPKASSN